MKRALTPAVIRSSGMFPRREGAGIHHHDVFATQEPTTSATVATSRSQEQAARDLRSWLRPRSRIL